MPTHWSEKYIGKRYVAGIYDCGDAVEEILNAEFHRDIYFPARWDDSLDHMTEQLHESKRNFGRRVGNGFLDGDVVLMDSLRAPVSHIGVLFNINGRDYCIHNVMSVGGVITTPMRGLKRIGFNPREIWRTA